MDAHIAGMARVSNRDRILASGMEVVHAHGFGGASVRDIVQAAGVPQGSFTNHFCSKEAFGVEIIDLYYACSGQLIAETLRNDALPPLVRLGAYLDRSIEKLEAGALRNGCLLGNLAAEASHDSAPIREKLDEVFADMAAAFASCLRDAIAAGDVPGDLDVDATAAYIVASLQGATLLAKVSGDTAAVERFRRILFDKVLR